MRKEYRLTSFPATGTTVPRRSERKKPYPRRSDLGLTSSARMRRNRAQPQVGTNYCTRYIHIN
jgi:hypothetical protein